MHAKNALALTLFSFVSLFIFYILVVDQLVIREREIPYPYRQFLLETTANIKGKVIIDSGSNSIYSIDPFELSKYFNAPVITVADNAGYPLRHKIFRLEKFIQQGDVIILPLEWVYYIEKKYFFSNYLIDLAGKDLRLEYYFNDLPLLEKIRFIFTQYPLKQAIKGISFSDDKNNLLLGDFHRLSIFERLAKSISRESFGNSSLNKSPKGVSEIFNKVRCHQRYFNNKVIMSNIFKANLILLKNLTKKGAHVYFAWPGMADSKNSRCYQADNVGKYASEIKNVVESAGFPFIGDFQQSHFTDDCILDSHYHLSADCATIRTQRLIKELQAAHIPKVNSGITQNDFLTLLIEQINRARGDVQSKIVSPLPIVDTGKVNIPRQIAFLDGWSSQEKFGRWSLGKESIFSFKIDSKLLKKNTINLKLQGHYFNGDEKTQVTINNISFGNHILTDKTFSFSTRLIEKNEIITIRLDHDSVISPAKLGVSMDSRKIKYALTGLTISQVK